MDKRRFFLGLDLSTQSLTAVVIDKSGDYIELFSINFDERYPSYKTEGGVLVGDDPTVVHSDPNMWMEALDDMLALLKEKELTRHICSIAVSAQQHGSVYLNASTEEKLSSLDPSHSMSQQLTTIFSRSTAPVWMDSSTNAECREITEALGGDTVVARLTGSRATERFAGPQIRNFWKEKPKDYVNTAHIALISSFATSLLAGTIAPIDGGDGYGTNLADIRRAQWSGQALYTSAPDLKAKLPKLVPQDEIVGNVSDYLSERFGFNPETAVVIGSGDNPCSLVGLGLIDDTGQQAVSLGTSDTYFGYLPELAVSDQGEGHVFGTADGKYMALLCFKNGSLARESIKDRFNLSWVEFSDLLMDTRTGNAGQIMLPYFFPEITPLVLSPRVWRFGGLSESDAAGNVRAVVEAQIMSMYLHSGWMGTRPQTILVTAGGSENRGLLKVISQVFNAEVHAFEVKDSAALGAAIRAAHCCLNHQGEAVSWRDLTDRYVKDKVTEKIKPDEDAVRVFHGENRLLEVYKACEQNALGLGEDPEYKIKQFKNIYCSPPIRSAH